jgi:transposase-like protein
MKKYRSFDEEFKRDIVARIDSGYLTKAQAAREHTLSSTLIDRWQSQIHDGSLRPRPSLREQLLRHCGMVVNGKRLLRQGNRIKITPVQGGRFTPPFSPGGAGDPPATSECRQSLP